MNELTRGEGRDQPLPPVTVDTCVRIGFAASPPASAKLVDRAGTVLAASGPPACDGDVGARGPVCFHPADAPRLLFDGDAGTVRFIVWSP